MNTAVLSHSVICLALWLGCGLAQAAVHARVLQLRMGEQHEHLGGGRCGGEGSRRRHGVGLHSMPGPARPR